MKRGRITVRSFGRLEEGEETNPARLDTLRRVSTASGFTLEAGDSRALSLRLSDGF